MKHVYSMCKKKTPRELKAHLTNSIILEKKREVETQLRNRYGSSFCSVSCPFFLRIGCQRHRVFNLGSYFLCEVGVLETCEDHCLGRAEGVIEPFSGTYLGEIRGSWEHLGASWKLQNRLWSRLGNQKRERRARRCQKPT